MNKLILTTIQKRWLMAALFITLALFGYFSWKSLSLEAYPDIADVTSQVVTQVPGLAAEEIEQQITIPIERVLNGLPGMHVMRSTSTFGLSIITVVFQDGVEDYWSRQRIQERLLEVELPYNAMPGIDPLTSPTGEIYRYIIESDRHSLRELTDLQNWEIIPRINEVSGVAEVSNFGGIVTQYQIEIDPTKLEQYKLSLSEITATIEENNANAGGSVLTQGDLGYVVRGIGLLTSLEDLGKIVVSSQNGVPIFLEDLGKLKYGTLERKGVLGFTDRERDYSESIQGIVLLLKHQNPSDVLKGITEAVEELNNGLLPEGVKIHTFLDRTDLIDTTLKTVSRTLLEGMALVIIVLIVFLGSWRGALLVAITIPFSLLIAFILMKLTNIPANLLSLGAIDFGIIVDGAIVMMETILKKREDNPEIEFEEKTIAERAAQVAKPIIFATLIIITAYLPLFAFERVEKKLFTPMAFTVGYALLGALVVALILIPGLAYLIYRKPQKLYHNKWFEKLGIAYQSRLTKILRRPKQVLIPLALILVGAVGFSISVGKDFLPTLDEGSIWLQVQLPPGISVEKSKEMSDTLRKRTMKYEEVTYIMVQAGRNDDGTDPWTASHFEVSVGLKPYKEWPRGKTKEDLINELSKEYASMPGYTVGFSQPMIDGVMDKIAGAHSELVVKVYGEDFKETRRIAEQVMTTLDEIKGAVDLAIDQEPPLPQLQVHIDRDAVARYGLNLSDVNELIEVAIGGKAISQVFSGKKVFDIVARYREDARDSPDKIAALMLTTASGATVPLSQIADVRLSTGESTITREMNKRHLTVKLNLRDVDLSSFLKTANQEIKKNVKYDPNQYNIKWGGQFENQNRAYERLSIVVPIALALMFLLLYAAFGQFRQAGLVLSIVPLAIFGGMLALLIRDMTLNVSSAVGFIALFGVAIQNGVIMVSHINDLRKQGMQLLTAVIQGSSHRFRPVLMTATVAALGLLPASLATGIGSDVQRPLATVIVYGLLFSTVITLFALPALYFLLEKKWSKNKLSSSMKVNSTLIKTSILILFISIGTIQSHAQATENIPKQKISYSSFMQRLGDYNLEYQAELLNLDIALAEVESARIFQDPSLFFEATDNGERKMQMGYEFKSALEWTVELGGKRKSRINVAKSQVELTQILLSDYFKNLRADATLHFLKAINEKKLLDAKVSSYEAMKKLAYSDSIRYELGDIMEIDARQSKLEATTLWNEVIQQEAEWLNALYGINSLIGQVEMDSLFLPEVKVSNFTRSYNLQSLIHIAQENRNDLKAALQDTKLNQDLLNLVKAERKNDLGLMVGISNATVVRNEIAPTPAFTSITAGLSIPLKFSNKNKGELKAARYAIQKSETLHKAMELSANAEIYQAHAQYQASQKQIQQYDKDLLKSAQRILDGKTYSYQRGETSLLEVLTAQKTYNEVQENYYEIEYAYQSALVELQRAIGIWDISI